MNKKVIMSGMRPTGQLHLGHYFGVLTNWIKLQNEFNCYFGIADWHALTTKFDKTQDLKQNVFEVALDWLSVGLNPDICTIYLQSLVPQTAEIHLYLSMITPQNWVERDPTLKDMAKILRTNDNQTVDVSYGLMGYPVLMTADILTFNAELVPVGKDQIAHLEISRDIIRRFNNIYGSKFNEPAQKLTQFPLLKGLDGQKMGKSFNNDIKIGDSEDVTTKKIMSAITDRSRIRRDDPGHPSECEVAFDYWGVFGNEEEVLDIKTQCEGGKIGCADCKRALAKKVNEHLAPIREKRAELIKNQKVVEEIIIEGSKSAAKRAQSVLDEIKNAVRMF